MNFKKEELISQVKDLEKQLGRRPTKHDNSAIYQKSVKYFGSWNKMMENAGYEVRYYHYPKIPKILTSELAYFLGLIITDGHLQAKKVYGVYIYTSYNEESEIIKKLIFNLFSYNAGLYKRKLHGFNKRHNIQISISSKDLVINLHKRFDMPIGNKSLIARVPKLIFNSNKKNISSFIRGVIDGDGDIIHSIIRISSGSYLFLKYIIKILSILGIKYKSKIQKEKTCYRLSLNKTDSRKIYNLCYKKAKYFYPRKKEKFLETNMFKNIKRG